MLKEVSSSVSLIGLEPGPCVDPDPDGCRRAGEIGLGSNAEAVWESGDAGEGSGEDGGVVDPSRVGRAVFKEARIGLF